MWPCLLLALALLGAVPVSSSALASPVVEDDNVTQLEVPEEYSGCLGSSDKQAPGVPSMPGTTTCRYIVIPHCQTFHQAKVGWGRLGGGWSWGTSAPHDNRFPAVHLCPPLPWALGLHPQFLQQHHPAATGVPENQLWPGLDRCRLPVCCLMHKVPLDRQEPLELLAVGVWTAPDWLPLVHRPLHQDWALEKCELQQATALHLPDMSTPGCPQASPTAAPP